MLIELKWKPEETFEVHTGQPSGEDEDRGVEENHEGKEKRSSYYHIVFLYFEGFKDCPKNRLSHILGKPRLSISALLNAISSKMSFSNA